MQISMTHFLAKVNIYYWVSGKLGKCPMLTYVFLFFMRTYAQVSQSLRDEDLTLTSVVCLLLHFVVETVGT